jgi:cell fate (sporulation/competence/biofilm development) regulator YmcA (YheA/YmcA/DUF963 family)
MSINAIYGKIQNIEDEISSLKCNSDNIMLKDLEKSVSELTAKVSSLSSVAPASSASSAPVSDSSVSAVVSQLEALEKSVSELTDKVSSDAYEALSSKLEALEQKVEELTGKVCEFAEATEEAKSASLAVTDLLAKKIEAVEQKQADDKDYKIEKLSLLLNELSDRLEYLENKD